MTDQPQSHSDHTFEKTCDVCGETFPTSEQVTYPAYGETFCSRTCKDQFLTTLDRGF